MEQLFDVDGNPVWQFNVQDKYGKFRIQHGMHLTPLLHGDRFYVATMHHTGQWVFAVEKALEAIELAAFPGAGEFLLQAREYLFQNGQRPLLLEDLLLSFRVRHLTNLDQ